MPSKLSFHISGYTGKTFDILERVQPSVVKVFNQNSEMSIDEIRRRCGALIVYRDGVEMDYHAPADVAYQAIKNSIDKLRGRGILWEGLNEPVPGSVDEAKALNSWIVRFAQIMHSEGELVAGFSWSTGNPTPDKWDMIVPYMVEAAAAVDVHTFHEYYTRAWTTSDWGRYRRFEQAMPPNARKPVIITECGLDETGGPSGGYLGRLPEDAYVEVLKQYDQLLLQDPFVLGATIFQWGDGTWPSFDISPVVDRLADYMVSVGRGYVIPRPWPVPSFGSSLSFTASPATIQKGARTTLQWSVSGAVTVTLDGAPVSATGSRLVAPTQTTTYTLHAVLAGGVTRDLKATVTVITTASATLVSASFAPMTLSSGQFLNVSMTVRNETRETLSTQPPNPGFIYDEGDTILTRGFPSIPGALRLGVDFQGRPTTVVDHPYRWGLGGPLGPGETRTVTGSIRVKTPQTLKLWSGLVQEQVKWMQDGLGTTSITVKPLAGPSAQIVQVSLSPVSLSQDQILTVSIRVQNSGQETILSQSPDPGFMYNEDDTFVSRGFPAVSGKFRVGIDLDGRTGIDHPYRWGFGAPLAPGETRTITGYICLRKVKATQYWAGLVREQVAWLLDGVGRQTVSVVKSTTPHIVSVAFSPTTLAAGNAIEAQITVRNDGTTSLATQGPDPGFVYDEGNTFATRGFPAITGKVRVGIDFDGRTGVDHPYRWGLGSPLAPGETRTITGSIRFKNAQTKNYWVGFVNEYKAWLQDRQGVQQIIVT